MTLNVTVASERCIYQSADFRLLDLRTGATYDDRAQKAVVVTAREWIATVCFSGVGWTAQGLDVSDWLADKAHQIQHREPLDTLVAKLLEADSWLTTVDIPHRRHTFTVGAFVGSRPVLALVSNFEDLSGRALPIAAERLSANMEQPSATKVLVSGQRDAVHRPLRRRLVQLADSNATSEVMFAALWQTNRAAAGLSRLVSPSCFTAFVCRTGDSGWQAHGVEGRPFRPKFMAPPVAGELKRILDAQFGAGKWSVRQAVAAQSLPTDDYHATQLRDKPNDASTHSNYGVHLKDAKSDAAGAERAYRRALELDPEHTNALGNLAIIYRERGDARQAAELYEKALANGRRDNENVFWNYSSLLMADLKDDAKAKTVVQAGVKMHSTSQRLAIRLGELEFKAREYVRAVEAFREAQAIEGPDRARLETLLAIALHLAGHPAGECIAQYRAAMELNPKDVALPLNLAQLLFVQGDIGQATALLNKARSMSLSPDEQMEASFYRLAHVKSGQSALAREIEALLAQGARLNWDVRPNIAAVAAHNPQKAAALEQVSQAMSAQSGDRVSLLRQAATRLQDN